MLYSQKGNMIMKMLSPCKQLALCITLISMPIGAIDNPHFYRATNFIPQFYEPRLAKPWLASFDVMLGFGSTHKARNGKGDKVPLLDIYGLYNMRVLGVNVPGKDLTNPADIALEQLAQLPANDGFAMLEYHGKFSLIEANFSFTQNIVCGFFVQAHLPVRRISVTDTTFTDLSPGPGSNFPNITTPAWQNFLAEFPAILQKYGVSTAPFHHTGIGDLSVLAGWTNNYEDTLEIDFFDTTLRAGVLFPTGNKINQHIAFDIASGYNGCFGFPITFDAAVGWYEWFTLGLHLGGMPFLGRRADIRMFTDCLQSGMIKLAHGEAHIDPGAIWEANIYMEADHVVCGLSLLAGYNFANKNRDVIDPCDTILFDPTIVNDDPQFLGWKMHTINLRGEWDFASYECPWYPHVAVFYNFIIGGKRIFNTNMAGFEIGIDFMSEF